MKKTLMFLFVAIFCTSISLNAQEMVKGTNFLSLGVGPSNNYALYNNNYSLYTLGGTPAIKFAFDHGFRKAGPGTISLGGSLGFFTKSYNGNTSYNYNAFTYTEHWTYFSATVRVGYYYNFGKLIKTPELNAYAGVGVGVLQRFYSYNGPYPYNSGYQDGTQLTASVYFGANYFLSKKFAVFTEFGYDISYVTLGVTFKL